MSDGPVDFFANADLEAIQARQEAENAVIYGALAPDDTLPHVEVEPTVITPLDQIEYIEQEVPDADV